MRVDLPLHKKTVENQDWTGLCRTGLPGRRASGPRGRRGPWAAGHWAFGPPGRWAAGLLLAKPSPKAPIWEMVLSEQIYIQVNEGRGEKQKFLQINKSVDSKQ